MRFVNNGMSVKEVDNVSKLWFKAASIRAIKTMAQSAIAMIGTGAVILNDINWIHLISAMALSGILSLLTSIAGLPEVNEGEKNAK